MIRDTGSIQLSIASDSPRFVRTNRTMQKVKSQNQLKEEGINSTLGKEIQHIQIICLSDMERRSETPCLQDNN